MTKNRHGASPNTNLILGLFTGLLVPACSEPAPSGDVCPGAGGCMCSVQQPCDAGLVCIPEGYCVFEDGTGDSMVGPTGHSAGDSTGDSTGGSTGPTSGAPVIVDVALTSPNVGQYEPALTVTVQVTDPDGLDDIVGGTLSAASGGPLLGPFVQVSGGTFVFNGLWSQLDDAGLTNDTDDLVLEVEFTDIAGNAATEQTSLRACTTRKSFCQDGCIDLDFDVHNCGECDFDCYDLSSEYDSCFDGECCGQYGCSSVVDDDPWFSSEPAARQLPEGLATEWMPLGFAPAEPPAVAVEPHAWRL